MTNDFWSDYRRLVARLMPPLGPGDGVPEAEIEAAETRLGVKMPTLLREFYALAGKREDINGVHNRLVSLENLKVDQNKLVFYEENQGVVLWGVDIQNLENIDPSVFMAEYQATLVWDADHNHLSAFLKAMLFWQAVNGGMPYSGIGTATSEAIALAGTDWELVDLSRDSTLWRNRVQMRDGQVLFISGNDPDPQVHGGGRTKADFLAVAKAFDVYWDYSTLDEEPDEELDEEDE
ncbi:MAG: hypothetical protein ACRYFS_11230 [Janthinobacterium lividum]